MKITASDILKDMNSPQSKKILNYLYSETLPKVRAHVMKNNGAIADANDVFQDAILSMYQKITRKKLEVIDNVGAYIFQSSKNLWLNKLRKQQRMTYSENDNIEQSGYEHIITNILNQEQQNAINELFKFIGERCKQLIALTLYEKKTMEEVAKLMGFANANAAKTQNYRCKKSLINLIEERKDLKLALSD